MRLSLTVVDPTTREREDVVLDADPQARLGDVVAALAGTVRSPQPTSSVAAHAISQPTGDRVVSLASRRSERGGADEPVAYVAGAPVDPEGTLAGSLLREGAVLSLHDPSGCLLQEPIGVLDLRVTSGPGAGVVHRLTAGDWSLGSSPLCGVTVQDPDVGPVAAQVLVTADGGCRVRPQDGAELHLERDVLVDEQDWLPGAQLRVGEVLLEVSAPSASDAALLPSPDGAGLDYNRPPRMLPPLRQNRFRLPKEPTAQSKRGIPFVMMLAPLAMSVPMALLSHRLYYLLFGLLSPVTMLANYFYDRRSGRRTHREQLKAWREEKATIEQEAQEALQLERVARRLESPDPATVLLTATGPRARLWERRRHDDDHLLLRFGTADQPSQVKLEDPEQLEHRRTVTWDAHDVPVTVAVREAGVVGVAGHGDLPRRLAAWSLAQLAVLQSPRDVQVWVLTDARAQVDWAWVRWLPHARPTAGQGITALIGTDAESVARRVGELGAVLTARLAAAREAGGKSTGFKDPDLLVVLDGARRLRSLPGVIALLKEGPAVGIYALCLDADERLLPEECGAVVTQQARPGRPSAEQPDTLQVRMQRADAVPGVRPDLVSRAWCERLARSLAPVRDVSDEDDDGAIPSSSRLLDVLGLEPPTAQAVAARWALGGRTTEAVVGESIDGPFAIDLRRDGPHALIAGTTGSGKSELLQTLVASLAVVNRPDAMTFVLVDYKGGSAFKDCVRLPHTVGMVTDLDTHLVERALTSLGAELRRREHLLADAGAKDIEDYTDLRARIPHLDPLPRLAIVIDEFASMARELPAFVTGLVNIAQRGRSLGIHLVLATQRPSGVVSPEIRANTNLRIALRVTDTAESSDVIDAPDAGRIAQSTPGRAYVRLGHASLVPFQAGRVGGRRPGAVAVSGTRPWVQPLGWAQLGQPAPQRPQSTADSQAEDTDLAALVEAVLGAREMLEVPAQHSPWLPALPDSVLVGDLPATPAPTGPGALPAVGWALEDVPSEQRRRAALVDLPTFGHLYLIGGPRSGRSQALRTIAGALAARISSADLHLYGLDCGNGALLALARLPHCGAVVQRQQTERAVRLLGRLAAEVGRRQDVLAEGSWADVTEQRAAVPAPQRLPHLMLLLDRWEGFLGSLGDLDGGALIDVVLTLLREGASVGVHVVLAGDRQLLSGRLCTLTEDKLVLRLPDRTDFSLAGLSPRSIPEQLAPGRGYRADVGTETQVALLATDPSGAAQAQALGDLATETRRRDREVLRSLRPFRVDVLPARLTFDAAWQLREEPDEPAAPLWAMVGVGGDELAARGADLAGYVPTFVVAGPARSGRSTVLLTMARSLLAGGCELVLAAPRSSPLRSLGAASGVRAVLEDDDLTQAELEPLMGGEQVVLVMDDAELLRDCTGKDYLRELVRTAADRRQAVVVAGNIAEVCGGFSGWQVDIRKNRHGMLLSPQQVTDGDLVGMRLPRSSAGGPVTPGRALLHDGSGDLITLQTPLTAPAW